MCTERFLHYSTSPAHFVNTKTSDDAYDEFTGSNNSSFYFSVCSKSQACDVNMRFEPREKSTA